LGKLAAMSMSLSAVVTMATRWAGPLLLLATLLCYLPALAAGYIWDDDYYLTANPVLREAGGWLRLWQPGVTVQYYPLVFSSFWLEYRIFGDAPFGYHLTNVLLHGGNAWLVALLARRLVLPWPWGIALLFALHPVHVESVAWITERKNVLSAWFYLLAAIGYLDCEAARAAGRPWRWRHALASLAFVAALLSKSVTCSLPAALLLAFAWLRQPIDWPRLRPLLPWFAVGLVLALHTASLERTVVGAVGPDWEFSFVERLWIASHAVWFYLGKLLWPHPLMFFYPRWEVATGPWSGWIPLLLCCVVTGACIWAFWRGRRGIPLALAFFVGSLFPALGFFNVYPMLYSFVADHFQYLASLGPLMLVAALGARWAKARPRWAWLPFVLPLACGVLTFQRCFAFRDAETLWQDTLAKNPTAWIAHNNLATMEADRGQYEMAMQRLRTATQLTASAKAQRRLRLNLGRILSKLGKYEEELAEYRSLQQEHGGVEARLARALERVGQDAEAATWYERAVLDPRQPEALLWGAMHWLRRGEPARAIPWLELHLATPRARAEEHVWLVDALFATGRPAEARTAAIRGRALAVRQADAVTVNALEQRLRRMPGLPR
jgi:tetratricopeptide (TPR) repeat protein